MSFSPDLQPEQGTGKLLRSVKNFKKVKRTGMNGAN